MRSQYFRFAVLLVLALALGGCETITEPGAPDQSFDIDQDIQDLEKVFKEKGVTIISFYFTEAEKAAAEAEKATKEAKEAKAAAEKAIKEAAEATEAADKATQEKTDAISAAEATPDDEEANTKVEKATAAADKATKEAAEAKAAAEKATKEAAEAKAADEKATKEAKKKEATAKVDKKDMRDQFISQRLTLINIQYIKFIRRFAVEKAQLDTAADMLIIGVNLAGTLVGAASTKGILAAISAGTSASRTSINKNFFHEKTVPVLVTAMNAERKTALVSIMEGLGKPVKDYPFARALSDLHLYYQAGTFIGALQAIQKDSGAKEAKADAILFPKITKEAVTEKAFQDRKDLMQAIDGLDPDKAKALITKIETEFPSTLPFVALQYPDDVRNADADGSKARKLLRRLVILTAKEPEARSKWKATMIDSL